MVPDEGLDRPMFQAQGIGQPRPVWEGFGVPLGSNGKKVNTH